MRKENLDGSRREYFRIFEIMSHLAIGLISSLFSINFNILINLLILLSYLFCLIHVFIYDFRNLFLNILLLSLFLFCCFGLYPALDHFLLRNFYIQISMEIYLFPCQLSRKLFNVLYTIWKTIN